MVGPPNNHDLTTKISTIDYCETGRGAFEECDSFFTIIWKQCRCWSVKNGLFWCWVRKKLQYFSTFVKEKGLFLNQKSGKIILGNCWEPCNIKRGKWCLPKKTLWQIEKYHNFNIKIRCLLPKTAIFIFADSAIHRKKIVVFDNSCQKEQELSFLP